MENIDTIAILIPKVLINLYISQDEFVSANKCLRKLTVKHTVKHTI